MGLLIFVYHYWCWRAGGAAPVKTSTGNNFPTMHIWSLRFWAKLLTSSTKVYEGRDKGAAKGVVRRNGCPKGRFWRVRFFSAPLRFALWTTPERSWKRSGGREETDSPKTPFWTTISPHDAFAAPLARSTNLLSVVQSTGFVKETFGLKA